MRLKRIAFAVLLAVGGILASALPAAAQSSSSEPDPGTEYVKVCSLYGAAFYYVPQTDHCVHALTGDTRYIDPDTGLVVRTWSPMVFRLMEETEAANRAIEAAAVTLAIPSPIILSGDRFAIAANWGQVIGYHAFGFAGAMKFGSLLSINAGFGIGLATRTIGTRFGLNLNW